MKKRIHEQPLSRDLETSALSDAEVEQIALDDELARHGGYAEFNEGEWVTPTAEELEALERPDNSSQLEDWYAEPLWSEVLPNLWQGGTAGDDEMIQNRGRDRARITSEDFDTVITMYASAQAVDWHVKEFRHGIYDSDMRDFDSEELFETVRAAHLEWKKGKKVLIRCQAGWNRSGLVMALVLIRDGMAAPEAIKLIRETRSRHALCNNHFVDFLLKQDAEDWQGHLFGKLQH